MGCLIKIKYTEKASEEPELFFLAKYSDFFAKCKIIETLKEANKCVFLVYTIWPENRTSDFLVNVLIHDRKIEKAQIVS